MSAPTLDVPAAAVGPADEVRKAHTRLLADLPGDSGPEDLDRVTEFIRQAVAAGRNLDDPEDRKRVQGLIDYWAASLPVGRREVPRPVLPETVLAEFDPARLRAAAEAAGAWLSGLTPELRKVARRIALRLVRLRTAGREFDLVPAARGALHNQAASAEEVEEVLRELVRVGVVRQTPGSSPDNDLFVLRSAALLTEWADLKGWLEERLAFRDRAAEWAAERDRVASARVGRVVDRIDRWVTRTLSTIGRRVDGVVTPPIVWLRRRSGLTTPSNRLLSGQDLEDARYHDRNPTERLFVTESRAREQLTSDVNRLLMGLFGLATMAAMAGLFVAGLNALGWRKSAEDARAQFNRADSERIRAESNLLLAYRNLELADFRRGQGVRRQLRSEEIEDELAAVLERGLNNPQGLTGDSEAGFRQRLQKIRGAQRSVKDLRDIGLPLRPGCRVWIGLPEEDPYLSSVCCIVRRTGRADGRVFAVVYYTPTGLTDAVVTRSEKAPWQDGVKKVIGHLAAFADAVDSRPRDAGPEEALRGRIALAELDPEIAADNEIPGLGRVMTGPVADPPAVGSPLFLIGSTSGLKPVTLRRVEPTGLLVYEGDAGTLGDGGGPLFNDRDELVGLHLTSQKGEKKGLMIAPWLAGHGLELVPAGRN
jgi:hypothetical protein